MTLTEFELGLSSEVIAKFHQRFEDGYDLDIDEEYTRWKTLKNQSEEAHGCTSLAQPTGKDTSSQKVSPAFKDVLVTPSFTKKGKSAARTLHMPKHMTGEAFIKMMEEKKRMKQEEAQLKEGKKLERERKKQMKLVEAELKEQERERKKQEREKLKKQKEVEQQKKKEATGKKKADALARKIVRENEKEATAKKREAEKRKKKRINKENCPPQVNLPSPSSTSQCMKCGGNETDELEEDWVACDHCGMWWHIQCTNIDPDLSAEAMDSLMWYCNTCK